MTTTKGRACDGKKQYTKRAAKAAAMYRRRRFGARPNDVHVYKCHFCGFFHIGHRPRHG